MVFKLQISQYRLDPARGATPDRPEVCSRSGAVRSQAKVGMINKFSVPERLMRCCKICFSMCNASQHTKELRKGGTPRGEWRGVMSMLCPKLLKGDYKCSFSEGV